MKEPFPEVVKEKDVMIEERLAGKLRKRPKDFENRLPLTRRDR